MKPVKHISVKEKMTVNELVKEMSLAGVMGSGKLAKAVELLEKMIKDRECKVFFGVAGAMVPGGMKNIILEFLRNGWADILVTTGATLTHDLVEALGHAHYQGSENADDKELFDKGLDRMYNSLMDSKVYQDIEDFFTKIFNKFPEKMNVKEFLWKIGENLEMKDSILKVCSEKKIPVFCPAITDSGIGLTAFTKIIQKKLRVDAFADLKEMFSLAMDAKSKGVFYVGGGTPKNYIQQAMQFSNPADYGVQITTDVPEFGGSSGASLKEGISWGKLNKDADFVDLHCDATIALPIITAALKDRLKHRNSTIL